MFKTELIEAVALKTKNTKVNAELVINETLKVIAETLEKNEDVNLIGFGSFQVKETKARTARNPKTGQSVEIEAGNKVRFKVSKKLKSSVK